MSAQKGMFSWFSSQVPPPLVLSNLMDSNPWASYLMLQAEHKIYSQFYTHFYQNLGKHSDRTLDEAVKVNFLKPEQLIFACFREPQQNQTLILELIA
jgi:hypothetical protein